MDSSVCALKDLMGCHDSGSVLKANLALSLVFLLLPCYVLQSLKKDSAVSTNTNTVTRYGSLTMDFPSSRTMT
jgi:hypothetical protein